MPVSSTFRLCRGCVSIGGATTGNSAAVTLP